MKTAEEAVTEVLEHHGVKGMKWGVTKTRDARTNAPTTATKGNTVGSRIAGRDSKGRHRLHPDFQKEEGRTTSHDVGNLILGTVVPVLSPLTVPSQVRLVGKAGRGVVRGVKSDSTQRKDRKFDRKASHISTMVNVHNNAVPGMNREQKKINAKYKGVDLTNPKNAAKQRKYHQETADMMAREYQKAANKMTNASGTKSYDVQLRGNDTFAIKTKKLNHADGEDEGALVLKGVYGKNGQIIDFKFDEIAQAEEFIDVLIHSGVKGMKWGVRKDRTAVGSSHTRTITDKAKVKTTGGTGHNAHGDAVKAAKTKQKIKKSGTASASNKELQELIERARLETQARDAVASKGKKFVKKKLGQQIDQGVNQEIQRTIKKQREGR